VAQAFSENPDLMKLLEHPKIVKEEKIKFIEDVFKGRISDEMTGFLVLIVDKGRQRELAGIFEYFADRVREYKNIGVAYVSTPVEMSDAQKEQVFKKLLATTKYTDFEMHYTVDESLIGGMVIRIGDRVVDSSIKTKLEDIARSLKNVQLA
ncbi:MAG: ATP synthase F1 subunit delta, partial [Lachnospiraceae bacterium]|nr:ATP synthase F1 subunit delta [Lachnospiraceae bacterium]